MTLELYWTLLLVIDGLLFFMGLHLVFGAISDKEWGSGYHKARIVSGLAFTATPFAGFTYYYLIRTSVVTEELATAVNLTAYCTTATLFAVSYMLLIGKKYDRLKGKYFIIACLYIIYLIPTWGGIIVNKPTLIRPGHILANIMLCMEIIIIGLYIWSIYRRTIKQMDDYFSEDVVSHVLWIERSIKLFAGLGIIAAISPLSHDYTIYLCAAYSIYQCWVFTYIYNSFRRFELSALTLQGTYEEEEANDLSVVSPKPVVINQETAIMIENGIDKWIKSERYTENGITIKSVALEICTNRTYLYSYINSIYGITFKEWIAHLRIDEAKKLLLYDYQDFSVAEIALKVGYTSTNMFIQSFSKAEGMTPSNWRIANKRSTHFKAC